MKKYFYILLVAFLLVFSFFLILGWYHLGSDLDDQVLKGEAYGFSIGSKKEKVYKLLTRNLAQFSNRDLMYFTKIKGNETIEKFSGVGSDGYLLIESYFLPGNYDYYEKINEWVIYFDGSYNNFIEFHFCDEKLCFIRRYKQHYELP